MKKLLIAGIFWTLFAGLAPAQEVALKTNLLYDATTTLNLGVEWGVAEKWTLDISGNYNPWEFSRNRQWKHALLQPEARYWFCEKFNRHFVGAHLHGAIYNAGKMKLPFHIGDEGIQKHRYKGWLAGAGVSYGYHWILGKRWSLEASIGLGYAYLEYDRFRICENCKEKTGHEGKHYFGPTKAALSIIYILK